MDRPDGTYIDHDGLTMNSISNYKDGKLNGVFKLYNYGMITRKYHYKDGKIHGKYTIYFNDIDTLFNNRVMTILHYVNGKKDGKCTQYNNDGNITNICYYKDDLLNGPFETYYINEKIKIKSYYINNKIDGLCLRYDKIGHIIYFVKINYGCREPKVEA